MNQTMHIFRKDTRRFWPEILISIAIVLGFVLFTPLTWRTADDVNRWNTLRQMIIFVTALVPISWSLLIARVIHAETLVGEDHFWITRPYERGKLLAAKVLFLVCWICVPYLLAQLLLLREAGFYPSLYVLGLLPCLVGIGALLLPLFALAAVTATFARLTLTLLASIAVFSACMLSTSFVHHGYSSENPYRETLLLYPASILVSAAAIVLQYTRRRVWLSRGILLLLPVLAGAITYAYQRNSLVDRAYARPADSSAPALQISLAADNHTPVESRMWNGDDFIDVPLRYAEVPGGQAVSVENYRFTVTSAAGDSWTSPWQRAYTFVLPGEGEPSRVALQLTPALFARFQSSPVTLHLTFALSRLRAGATTTAAYPSHDTAVPGLGFCSQAATRGSWSNILACRFALRPPQLTYMTTTWWDSPCIRPAPASVKQAVEWVGSVDPNVLDVSISVATMFLRGALGVEDHRERWHVCPGSPLTLTPYHIIDRTQADTTFTNFTIPPIAFSN